MEYFDTGIDTAIFLMALTFWPIVYIIYRKGSQKWLFVSACIGFTELIINVISLIFFGFLPYWKVAMNYAAGGLWPGEELIAIFNYELLSHTILEWFNIALSTVVYFFSPFLIFRRYEFFSERQPKKF